MRWACFAVVVVAGCSGSPEVALLDVHTAGPKRLDPGIELEVRGAGFPAGRDGRLSCDGELFAPGEPPRRVQVELSTRARSDGLAVATITDSVISRFGGRGTFRGTLRVAFDAPDGASVVGQTDVELDLAPATRSTLASRRRELDAAAALSRDLGWELAEDASGVFVENVLPGGWAERASVLAGDRVEQLGGVLVRSERDMRTSVADPRLVLQRPGRRAPIVLRLPTMEATTVSVLDPIALGLLALIVLLAFTLGPLAAVADRRRMSERWSSARPRQRLVSVVALVGSAALSLSPMLALLGIVLGLRCLGGAKAILRLAALSLCVAWAWWVDFEPLAGELGVWFLVLAAIAPSSSPPRAWALSPLQAGAEAALLAVLLLPQRPWMAAVAPTLMVMGWMLPVAGGWSRALSIVGCAACVVGIVAPEAALRSAAPELVVVAGAAAIALLALLATLRGSSRGDRLHLFL